METSDSNSGFNRLDAGWRCDAAGRKEIYKNLRWPEDHDCQVVTLTFEPKTCAPPSVLIHVLRIYGQIFPASREAATRRLVGQQDAQVAKIISGGSGDE